MISFEEFKELLKEKVVNMVDGEVSIVTAVKNNGVKLDALSVKRKTSNLAPIIYLDSFYKDYKNGRSIESIVETIVSISEQDSGIDKDVINNFCDYDVMKEYLEIKLINKESNKELLRTVPHLEFLDLAIVCMVKLPFENENGTGSILIHKSHFEKWNISVDEMFNVAANNSMEKEPAVIKCMNDVIKEMYIGNCDLEEQEEELRQKYVKARNLMLSDIAHDLKYIDNENFSKLEEQVESICKMIQSMCYLRKNPSPHRLVAQSPNRLKK